MRDRLTRTPMTLLVSALLMVGSLVPPGTRHQHAMAQGRLVSHVHEDLHSHPHAHHHCEHSLLALVGDLWHLHFDFFGLDVTLPDTVPSEDDTQQRNGELVYIRVAESLPPCPAGATAVYRPLSVDSARVWDDAAPFQAVAVAPPPVTSPPLCDRARLERSGVLLA